MEKKLQRALQLYAEAVGKSEEVIIEKAVRNYLIQHYAEVEDRVIEAKILRLLKGESEEPSLTIEELGITLPLGKVASLIRKTLDEHGGSGNYYNIMKAVLKELGIGYDRPQEVTLLKSLHSSFFVVERGATALRSYNYLVFKSNGEFPALDGVYIVGNLDKSMLNKGFYPILKYSYMIEAENNWGLVKKALSLLKSTQNGVNTDV